MDIECLEIIEAVRKLEHGTTILDPIWIKVINKIKECLLPEQSYGEDRPSKETDFAEHFSKSLVGLQFLRIILRETNDGAHQLSDRNFTVWAFLICGEYSSKHLWTSPESIELSKECLQLLLHHLNCKSVSDVLVGDTGSPQLLSPVLHALRPKLLKETWRLYPGAVQCYKWILHHVKRPYLSDHLNAVLPTALIILDDHVLSHKIIGITAISHIIQNVARTELCSQGLDNMLYHTLQPLLYQREPEIITHAYACVITLLAITERGYTKTVKPGEWGRLESVLSILLRNMECEDRLVLRLAYVQSLSPILETMGPSVIQLSKKILDVIDEYLDKTTPDARHYALMAFETYISNSSERLSSNGERIMFLLLRTLYDETQVLQECELCSMRVTNLCLKNDERANFQTNSLESCATHDWVGDIEIIIRCFNYIYSCVPVHFDLIRNDVIEKISFNPLLSLVIQNVFCTV